MKVFFQTHKKLITKTTIICSIVLCTAIIFEIVSEVVEYIFDIID